MIDLIVYLKNQYIMIDLIVYLKNHYKIIEIMIVYLYKLYNNNV